MGGRNDVPSQSRVVRPLHAEAGNSRSLERDGRIRIERVRSPSVTLARECLDSDANPPQILDGQDALNRINMEGLTGECAGMVSTYVRTGILDRVGLEKIGRALNVAYVFQPSLASFSQSMSGRLSILGLRILQTRVTALRLALRLWNTRTGEIVWESSCEATLASEGIRESRIPFDEIARRLWSYMLDELFTGLPVE